MLYAVLSFERSYVSLDQLKQYLEDWVTGAGVFAMIIIGIWGLWFVLKAALRDGKWSPQGISGQLGSGGEEDVWKVRVFHLLLLISLAGMAATVVVLLSRLFGSGDFADLFTEQVPGRKAVPKNQFFHYLFFWTCILSLLTVSWEFIVDLFRMSPRRLYAIARFAVKEALRRKVLWSFLLLGAVFLLGSWFVNPTRREYQWAQYVELVFLVMTVMVLVTSAVLACFSLPHDIKHQTIFTVVTKPVRRLEIILGRILGLIVLMTFVLLVSAGLSIIFVSRGIDPEITKQAHRSRVVIFAPQLLFNVINEQGQLVTSDKGMNVGREWEYFQYIRGGSSSEAIWYFSKMPEGTSQRATVPVEFSFDIYRTSKGSVETFSQGLDVHLTFINTAVWDPKNYNAWREAKSEAGIPLSADEKARKFGYYETPRPVKAFDEGVTNIVNFPGSIMAGNPNGVLEVHVNCRSTGQYLGTARKNLYIIDRESPWYLNFFKGVTSIFFYMVLIVVIGVVFSTYFNAPISLMLSILLIILGQPRIRDYIYSQSLPDDPLNDPGGKFFEATLRIAQQENLVTTMPDTGVVRFAKRSDDILRHLMGGVHKVLPNLSQYDRDNMVKEGFDIPNSEIAASGVVLFLYLFPFLILGYYFLTGREVAA